MNKEQMTPEWVVKNFLLDYDERIKTCSDSGFIGDMFHEALVSLLEAQREECYDRWETAMLMGESNQAIGEAILNAIIEI